MVSLVKTPRHRSRAVVYGDLPIAALAMVLALQNGEQSSLSVGVDGIQKQFHVSSQTIGLLPLVAGIIGVAAVIPFGVMTDRFRRTWILAGSMALWVACMAANGAAGSFTGLLVARSGVGAIEASSPAAISLISDYYPIKMRSSKMGWYQLGALLGAIFGYIAVGTAVGIGGWRWSFYTWLPLGVVSVFLLLRAKEPRRGDQDRDYHAELQNNAAQAAVTQRAELEVDQSLERISAFTMLPEATRVGALDYAHASGWQVTRELMRIKSMWFGCISITVSQLLLNGVGFWAIPYFERVHHLSSETASLLAALLAVGSVIGILSGGKIADALLRRGIYNGRIYIIATGSVLATALLMPAFASTSLLVTAPLFFLGGVFLLLPLAPNEAMIADVVVCELRGRATTVRSIVRTGSLLGTAIIGFMIDQIGIRQALTYFTPIYAIGGLLVLFSLRSYGTDLAFVLAESQRTSSGQGRTEPTASSLTSVS